MNRKKVMYLNVMYDSYSQYISKEEVLLKTLCIDSSSSSSSSSTDSNRRHISSIESNICSSV